MMHGSGVLTTLHRRSLMDWRKALSMSGMTSGCGAGSVASIILSIRVADHIGVVIWLDCTCLLIEMLFVALERYVMDLKSETAW